MIGRCNSLISLRTGGFDAVIGNPPYLNIDDTWGKGDTRLQAIKNQYPHVYNDKTDILFYFIAKAVELSKRKVGFIVSRAFLEAFKADKLRGFLAGKRAVAQIVDFRNFYVFDGVGITTCILQLEKASETPDIDVYKLLAPAIPNQPLENLLKNAVIFEYCKMKKSDLSNKVWTFASPEQTSLNKKVDAGGDPLGKILHIGQGMQTGRNEVFGGHTLSEMHDWNVTRELFHFRAANSDIRRYDIRDRGEVLIFVEDVDKFSQLPSALGVYFQKNAQALKGRAAFKRGDCEWWKYTWPLHREYYSRQRLISPFLASENRFALVDDGRFIGLTDTTVLFDNGQPESLKYLMGLLNSRLLTIRFRTIGKLKSGGIYEYFWNSISKLPIRRIDFSSAIDRAHHKQIVELVDKMRALASNLKKTRVDAERSTLQNAFTATDRRIDALVYELYGLTQKEIDLVEKS